VFLYHIIRSPRNGGWFGEASHPHAGDGDVDVDGDGDGDGDGELVAHILRAARGLRGLFAVGEGGRVAIDWVVLRVRS
jgi:hypothetical protein